MRTPLTLDPDVTRMVNDEVRRGLASPDRRRRLKPYRVRPHAARLLLGIARARLNALADEQEDAAIVGVLTPRPFRSMPGHASGEGA